jgi:hypothetical protein
MTNRKHFGIKLYLILLVFALPACALKPVFRPVEPGSIHNLAMAIDRNIVINKKKTLAVFDFYNADHKLSPPGRLMAEELRNKLVNIGHFSVISVNRIDEVLKKNKTVIAESLGRRIKDKLRKKLHADAMCTGMFIEEEGIVKLKVQLYDAEKIPLLDAVKLDVTNQEIAQIGQNVKKAAGSINWQLNDEKTPYKKMIENIDWGPLQHHFIIDDVRFIQEKPIRLETGGRYYDYRPVVAFHIETRESFNITPSAVLYHAYVIYKNPRPGFKAKFFNAEGEENYYFGSLIHFEPSFLEWRKGEVRQGFFVLPHLKEIKDYENVKITYWP